MTTAKSIVKRVIRGSRFLNAPVRFMRGLPIAARPLGRLATWTVTSREDTNFTYPLQPLNVQYLAHAVSVATGRSANDIKTYIAEAQSDTVLAEHVVRGYRDGPNRSVADQRADFAKRLGWYAVVRATKPRIVVESGVDKGLGAVVLAAAIARNGVGRYFGIDIDPTAGSLLSGAYAKVGEMLYGSSLSRMAEFEDGSIDLIVSDSDHSPGYEAKEYDALAPKLSSTGIVLSDNSHVTPVLMEWSERHDRRFLFWAEKPHGHWYPGSGIGFSFPQ